MSWSWDELSNSADLAEFERQVRSRARLGGETSAWVEAIMSAYAVRPQTLLAIGAEAALKLAAHLVAPRVRRDAFAWSAAAAIDEAPHVDSHPRVAAVLSPPSPLAPTQRSVFTGVQESAQRFHRSMRQVILATPAPDAAPTPVATQDEEALLWKQMENSSAHPLPHAAQVKVEQALGQPAPSAVQLHDGVTADAVARRHDADAVTRGDQVAFRLGTFRPESVRGMALLAHELVHVMQTRQVAPAPWADAPGRGAGEQQALDVERGLLGLAPVPEPVAVPSAPQSAATQVRAAASDRLLEASPTAPAGLAPEQVRHLKEEIYRDLVDKIRVEFERGRS